MDFATNYNYNQFNKVSKITNPLNQIMQSEYDKNGNTAKVIFPKEDTVFLTNLYVNVISVPFCTEILHILGTKAMGK